MFMTWAAFLIERGYGGSTAVWINIDESALPLYLGGRFGNVCDLGKENPSPFASKASLSEKRKNVTLVASVCTDIALQRHLPQYLIPNSKGQKIFWATKAEQLEPSGNVIIIPDEKGWVNTAVLDRILTDMSKVTRARAPGKRKWCWYGMHILHIWHQRWSDEHDD